jgi:hypothetical protein
MSEQINFEDELRKYARAIPFFPFEIVVTSGDRYEVTDPLQLAIGGNSVALLLPRTGIKLFRKNQIVAVQVNQTE